MVCACAVMTNIIYIFPFSHVPRLFCALIQTLQSEELIRPVYTKYKILEQLRVGNIFMKLPAFYGVEMFVVCLLYLERIVSNPTALHCTFFYEIHFNIVLTSVYCYYMGASFQLFCRKFSVYVF